MTREDLDYLSLMYQTVEDADQDDKSGKFYRLINAGEPGFSVCDDHANLISDLRFEVFSVIGPFVSFTLYTPDIIIDAGTQDEVEKLYKTDKTDFYLRYRYRMSFLISINDLQGRSLLDVLNECEVYSEIESYNIRGLCNGKLYSVKSSATGKMALFNDQGYMVAPFVYSNIYFSKELTNGDLQLKVKVASRESNYENFGDWVVINYSTASKRVEYYFLVPVSSGRYAAATSYIRSTELLVSENTVRPMIRLIDHYKLRYRLLDYCGKLHGNEYESIKLCKNHTLFGKSIFEVQNHAVDKEYYGRHSFGYIADNGFELIKPNEYFAASPIGDCGLFKVTRLEDKLINKHNSQSHGIWDGFNQKMVESIRNDTAYVEKHLSGLTIFMAEVRIPHKPVMKFIVGNDGKLYDNLNKAFEIYRDLNNPKIHIIILYGKKYYCEIESWNKIKILKNKLNEKKYSWVKVA